MKICCRWVFILVLGAAILPAGRAAALDGQHMLKMVYEQCNFGPRIPGTPAHEAGRQWIAAKIKETGLTLKEEPFTAALALNGKTAGAVNLWGFPSADGPTSPALVLSAHWDTRPWADQDPSGSQPLMDGANDGAAAVAVVLELARALRATPLGPHVVVAFWDAEDSGVNDKDETWAIGAQYAAAHPPAWIGRIRLGILLDMVAGADLALYPETYSQRSAKGAVSELWRLGGKLAPTIFKNDDTRTVTDDHLPWIRSGVPFIDLVGINFKYWHTAGDSPEHCSPATMEAVGNVLYNYAIQGGWKK